MSANQPPEGGPQGPGTPQGPGIPQGPGTPQGIPQGPPPGQGQPAGYPGGAPQLGPDGQPVYPGAYPPPGGFQPPVAEPPKKAGTLKRILTSVGIAVLVILGGILWRSGVFDTPSLKVGACVQQTSSDSVKTVDCGSAEAQYKVLGIKEKQSQASGRLGACNDWPDTTSVYWEGRNNSSGTVYCLQKL